MSGIQPAGAPWEKREPVPVPQDPWDNRAGRGFTLEAKLNAEPRSSKSASQGQAKARFEANAARDRNLSKPPDLGALGFRLAKQKAGVGTAAVPFPDFTEEDLLGQFPEASVDQVRELLRLQKQNQELMKQLQQRRRNMVRVKQNAIGETSAPLHTSLPHVILVEKTWRAEFHNGSIPVVIECKKDVGSNDLQRVIIRMCRGIDHPVSIYVEGIADLVLIEDCANCSIIIECCLNGICVNRCVNTDLVIASEVPDTFVRDSTCCDLTLCPDNMDGGIETMRSESISLQCVFHKGIVALEPEDLLSASTRFTAIIPCRVVSRHEQRLITHECRAHGHLPNAAQLFWKKKAAALEEQAAEGEDDPD